MVDGQGRAVPGVDEGHGGFHAEAPRLRLLLQGLSQSILRPGQLQRALGQLLRPRLYGIKLGLGLLHRLRGLPRSLSHILCSLGDLLRRRSQLLCNGCFLFCSGCIRLRGLF